MKCTFLLLAILLLARPVAAAEGMFLLDKLPVDALKRAGLKISAKRLLTLSRAVVRVARGGSGSFVSPEGLVVTNHHVAFRCLARINSQKAHIGLLERGFLAKTRAEELHCPGYDLLIVQRVVDVTQRVKQALRPRMSWAQRFEAIRLKKQAIVDACEKSGQHVCSVAALDGGRGFLLTVQRRIRDVRLVYTPPKDLGKYGGDIDNWMYPRHTADFTFLRAYVGKDGKDQPYSKANVSLRTPVYLKVSARGIKRGDLSLVIGFPARTSRHVTSHELNFYAQVQVAAARKVLKRFIELLHREAGQSADSKRKYAALEAGVQNAFKYYKMLDDGMQRWKVMANKRAREQLLFERIKRADAKRHKRLLQLHKEIGKLIETYRGFYHKLNTLRRLTAWGSASLATAHDIVKWGEEKQKPNAMRKKQRYKTKNVEYFLRASRRLEASITAPTEKAILVFFLKENWTHTDQRLKATRWLLMWSRNQLSALARIATRRKQTLPAAYANRYGTAYSKDPLVRAVDMLYASTRVVATRGGDAEMKKSRGFRDRALKMTARQIDALNDPFLRFAQVVMKEYDALEEGPNKVITQYFRALLHPEWVDALQPPYPDANSTVRLTFGRVADYTASATGKWYRFVTDIAGLLKKHRGKFPFNVPARLRAAFNARLSNRFVDRQIKDVPVNFTTTLDTTGGNSGSPILDARGQLVGLLFDGTPEAVISDWQYQAKEQRSICVDIRYALYLASVEKATQLLKELGVR